MIIEYTATASQQFEGNGWTAYRRKKSGVTRIFDDLWYGLKDRNDLEYHQLEDKIVDLKFNSSSKAFCWVMEDNGCINICQRGVMPIIWIIKSTDK